MLNKLSLGILVIYRCMTDLHKINDYQLLVFYLQLIVLDVVNKPVWLHFLNKISYFSQSYVVSLVYTV